MEGEKKKFKGSKVVGGNNLTRTTEVIPRSAPPFSADKNGQRFPKYTHSFLLIIKSAIIKRSPNIKHIIWQHLLK